MRHDQPLAAPIRRHVLPLLVLLLGLASAPAGHAADLMKKQPYLIFPGDPVQMQVLWQLTATATSTLAWGTDTTCAMGSVANAEYGSDHQHAYTIDGLTAGTKYHYRVTTDGIAYRGSFNTAPNAWATKLKFLAYGDTRTYPATHNQVAGAMLSTLAADSSFQSLVLFMGDYVTTGTSEALWTSEFFDPTVLPNVRTLMANTAHQAAIGNHEGTGVLFVKYLPYPFVAGRYWSFDYGPIHVTVVDQYTSYSPGSAQYQWIVDDLARTNKTWKFLLLHEPGWSAYGGHPNNTVVQAYLQPLCLQYGVSIVFGGHNHYYSRATVNGVQHLTTGGGGAPLETPDGLMPYIVASARANHHCTIAIDGDTLRFKAFNTANGAVLDSFTLQRPAVAPDSTFPLVAVSAPDGGETWKAGSVHAITWSASDDVGIAAVDLACSTDGGSSFPFLIARGLANSGTYSWTVPNTVSSSVRVRATVRDSIGNLSRDASAGDFVIDNWIINASAGANGSIVPGGNVPVLEGANQRFSILRAPGFQVSTLTVDGSPVTPDTTYTFTAVAAHHTIAATFVDAAPPAVHVTSPVGSEVWPLGTSQTITWTATDNAAVNRVDVDYSLTGPAGPWLAAGHDLANSGSLPWTVPMQRSDSALVRVTAWDPTGNSASDTSDSLFYVYDPNAAVPGGAPVRLFLARPLPDPSAGSALLRFGLPAAGRVRLEILDLAGRHVWRSEGDLPAGEHAWRWNGEADQGGRAETGLYFIRLVTPWGTRTERLVRLR
jgi:hypothetical protein